MRQAPQPGICSVLAVIPALDEAGDIETVVRVLAREKARLTHLEIVVVDGGSHDHTRSIVGRLAAELPFVHLIHNPHGIQSAAVNLAARQWAGRADIMVRCDAHATYPDRYIERLLQTLRAMQAASVVVPMDCTGRGCFQKAVAWVCDTPVGSGGAAHRAGRRSGYVDHGHHAAFRLAAFLAVGGYDESFTHNEDAELDCRLAAAGYPIYLDADIRIAYFPRASALALWEQYFRYGIGRSRTVRKHVGSLRARQLAPPVNLVLVFLSALAAATSGIWWWLFWPLIYLTILGLTSLALALRKASLCGLLAGIAAATIHTAWGFGFLYGVLFVDEYQERQRDSGHVGQAIGRNRFHPPPA